MKKLLSLIAAAALAVSSLAQNVTLQKTQHAASPPDTLISTSYIINVPTGGILQATGSGQIISTGGAASTLPWSGLTGIPSPTLTLTGDGATTQTFLAGGGSTSAFTLATVNANTGSWGSATQAPVFTVNGKGLITAAANATVTPVYTNVTTVPTVSLLGNGTVGTANASAITLGTSLTFATTTSLNTIQGIRTADSPTFAGLTLSSPLTGANGGTGVSNSGKTITLGGNLTTSGAFATTLTETANTSLTLPITGTLATLAGAEALTNKTYNGNTWTAGTGTLTLAAASTLSTAGSLATSGAFNSTFTMTGNTSVTFPTSGTLATTTGYVSDHQTTNSSGNSTVTPTTQLHTEEITLSGSSGARGIIVGTSGIVAGARTDLIFTIPATAGIAVTVYSGSLVGAVVQTFTTTGAAAVTSARLTCNYTNSQWNALYYQGPIP